MANNFENTVSSLDRPEPPVTQNMLAVVVLVGLLLGAVLAAGLRAWPLLAIFAVTLAGAAVYVSRVIEQQRRLAAALSDNRLEWESAIPEIQRQSLNVEVGELSKILDVAADQLGDLQSAYIIAEDLALRQIQHEENVPLMRHVGVCRVPFDAVMLKDGFLVCADVCFLISPELRQDRVDAMLRKIDTVNDSLNAMQTGMSVRLMIVLITQLGDEDERRLRSSLGRQRFSATPVDIDIRLLDFEALQRIYVTE